MPSQRFLRRTLNARNIQTHVLVIATLIAYFCTHIGLSPRALQRVANGLHGIDPSRIRDVDAAQTEDASGTDVAPFVVTVDYEVTASS